MTTVAIDAMGGDFGLSVTVPAAVKALAQYPGLHLILVGDENAMKAALSSHSYDESRLTLKHASQCVEMNESPSQALRSKKDSSMRVAINLVKEGGANACVSAGNTGALMATARFVLKTLPGIDRPAIISTFPTIIQNKNMRMLDLGANVDSSAENLLQFAVMGSVLSQAVDNIENPKVCLLNIGEEEIKGNEQVRKTAQLLSDTKMVNYIGYIEGDRIYLGDADVIVCDGFVGNVTLKTTEGVVKMMGRMAKSAFMQNIFTKIIGLFAKKILRPVVMKTDPDRYNGATFIGLNGTVIKSHGSATINGFANAIKEAMIEVEKNIPERIRKGVELLFDSSVSSQDE